MSGLVTQASTPLFDRSEPNERRAIVHIGTEKTGSTSVQNLLYKNTKVLKKAGFLFPSASCGLISNFRLLIQTRSAPDLALMRLDKRHPVSADTLAQWRVKFEKRHRKEVESFQSQRSTSTVIYSSEHFHSRLTDPGDLQALLQFLEPFYDSIKVVCYLRRQDMMVRSAHNTAVQGGLATPFDIRSALVKGPYYDYLGLLNRWSEVFGRENVSARVFDRARMVGGDVVRDFAQWSGISDAVDIDKLVRERSNSQLSHFALEVLRAFNGLNTADERLGVMGKEGLRQSLISAVHDLRSQDHIDPSPSRSQAQEVVDFHRENNQRLACEYLGDAGFSDDLSAYPEDAVCVDVVEADVHRTLNALLFKLTKRDRRRSIIRRWCFSASSLVRRYSRP
jgi:hypothetical protein